MVEILTSYDLIKEPSIARFEDNLFIYEHVEHSLEQAPHRMDSANGVPTYEHDVEDVDSNKVSLNSKFNARNEEPFDYEELYGENDRQEHEDDYSDLIISPNHFEKCKHSKGKSILQDDENKAPVNQTLCEVIWEAYSRQPN